MHDLVAADSTHEENGRLEMGDVRVNVSFRFDTDSKIDHNGDETRLNLDGRDGIERSQYIKFPNTNTEDDINACADHNEQEDRFQVETELADRSDAGQRVYLNCGVDSEEYGNQKGSERATTERNGHDFLVQTGREREDVHEHNSVGPKWNSPSFLGDSFEWEYPLGNKDDFAGDGCHNTDDGSDHDNDSDNDNEFGNNNNSYNEEYLREKRVHRAYDIDQLHQDARVHYVNSRWHRSR